MSGPLSGVRVVELGGIGPAPFGTMMLGELGADVIRVDRPGGTSGAFKGGARAELLNRGKRSIALDLKKPDAVETFLEMVDHCDILVESYRPGVAERLGVGPDVCRGRNSRLIYARMTGWGQYGPLSRQAGHDLNFLSVTGALHAMGDANGPPQIPLNLVGDFGGGGVYLAVAVLAALRETEKTGTGGTLDVAIVDNVMHLLTSVYSMLAAEEWTDERGTNMTDGGAPFYHVYEASDHEYLAVAALQPKFYATFLEKIGSAENPAEQFDRSQWPRLIKHFAAHFKSKTQREWTEHFDGTDACVSPVISLLGASRNHHIQARGLVVSESGLTQPRPAPHMSTQNQHILPPPIPGEHTVSILTEWGVSNIENLLESGAAVQAGKHEKI